MDAKTFLAEFGHIANAPGGIDQIRNLILALAYRGELLKNSYSHKRDEIDEKLALEKSNAPRFKQKDKALLPISDNATIFNIPENWCWQVLGNIGFIFNGNSISNSARENIYANVKEGLPFISTPDVQFKREPLNYDSGLKIPFNETKFKSARKDAVLICSEGGSAGRKAGITDREICFGNKLFAIEVFNSIYAPYVYNYYQSDYFRAQFKEHMTGIIGGVSLKKFQTIGIPVPPLEEQKRIVKKVDELMNLCDKLETQQQQRSKLNNYACEASLTRVVNAQLPNELSLAWSRIANNLSFFKDFPKNIEDIKQSIRQLALRGLLVSDDYSISDSLSDAINNAKDPIEDSEFGWKIPDSWIWCRFGWMGESRLGKMLDKSKNTGIDMPYLRNLNVRWRDFDLSDVLEIKVEEREIEKVSAKKNDLLICEGGEPGRSAIWYSEDSIVIQKALHRFRCGENIIPEYALLCIETDFMSGRLSNYYTGAAIKHLTGKSLSRYVIPVPPVETQHAIVDKVAYLISICNQLLVQVSGTNDLASRLAQESISAITCSRVQEQDKMKAPKTELVSQLKLNVSPANDEQAPLSAILIKHNGELSAKALWNYSGLNIQDFYQQLKIEMANRWIVEPEKAGMRELEAG